MAVKIQYNKTCLQQLNRALQIRQSALPILTAKELALRLEVHRAKQEAQQLAHDILSQQQALERTHVLWQEFPEGLVSVAEVKTADSKIAGVPIPVFDRVIFSVERYSLIGMPAWIPAGVEMLKALVELSVREEIARRKVAVLERARRRTTQKVNLYEKVQIPDYQEAILKIKRFLEDEENLAKSSQKILKAKISMEEMAA